MPQELQRVFGHMQEGIAKVYDPAPFATLLGIDKGIQQDPQVSPCALGWCRAGCLVHLPRRVYTRTSNSSSAEIPVLCAWSAGLLWLAQDMMPLYHRARSPVVESLSVSPYSVLRAVVIGRA